MTPTRRTRTAADAQHYEAIRDEYARDGYAVVSEGEATVTLRYRDHGGVLAHLGIFLFFGWWTVGLANLGYALWRRYASTDVVEVERAYD